MGRGPRVVVPGRPHHITQRGNNRQVVFHDAEDYLLYLRLMRIHMGKHRVNVYGYCLMSNHTHQIIVPAEEGSLSLAMSGLQSAYTRHYHARYGTSGHVWQGRFKCAACDDSHLWAALRYVERNPVRAKIVTSAEQYPWSSAMAHCGLRQDLLLAPLPQDDFIPTDWRAWLAGEDELIDQFIRACTEHGRPCMRAARGLTPLSPRYEAGVVPGPAGQ